MAKYLIMARPGPTPMPPNAGAALSDAAKTYLDGEVSAGRLECCYTFSSGTGGFAIANADSPEELFQRLLDYPMYPFFQFDVEPLVDYSVAFPALGKLMSQMAQLAPA